MKFEKNHQYFNIALYAFLAVAASIIFYETVQNADTLLKKASGVFSVLQPVIIGIVLAYILNPILRFFDDRMLKTLFEKKLKRRWRRGIAIVLTYLVAIIFLCLFMAIVLPQLYSSITSIVLQVPAFVQTMTMWYETVVERLASMKIISQGEEISMLTNETVDKLTNMTQSLIDSVMQQFEKWLPAVWLATAKITNVLLNVILGIIISIYLLFDREKFFAQIKKLLASIFPQKTNAIIMDVAHESHKIFSGFITGTIIDSVIVGILCFIGMCIFKMPYAVLISVIVGVTNVIPYFGPFIGAVPGFLIIYIVDPGQAFWFLLFILLLQQFDGNILSAKILGDSTGLSAFWVVFAITLFGGVFGIMGMFIGVPLFAVIYSMIKRLTSFFLARKGKSVYTSDYDSEENPL